MFWKLLLQYHLWPSNAIYMYLTTEKEMVFDIFCFNWLLFTTIFPWQSSLFCMTRNLSVFTTLFLWHHLGWQDTILFLMSWNFFFALPHSSCHVLYFLNDEKPFCSNSHRPVDIHNAYNGVQIKLLMRSKELSVPEYDEVFRDDLDVSTIAIIKFLFLFIHSNFMKHWYEIWNINYL